MPKPKELSPQVWRDLPRWARQTVACIVAALALATMLPDLPRDDIRAVAAWLATTEGKVILQAAGVLISVGIAYLLVRSRITECERRHAHAEAQRERDAGACRQQNRLLTLALLDAMAGHTDKARAACRTALQESDQV